VKSENEVGGDLLWRSLFVVKDFYNCTFCLYIFFGLNFPELQSKWNPRQIDADRFCLLIFVRISIYLSDRESSVDESRVSQPHIQLLIFLKALFATGNTLCFNCTSAFQFLNCTIFRVNCTFRVKLHVKNSSFIDVRRSLALLVHFQASC